MRIGVVPELHLLDINKANRVNYYNESLGLLDIVENAVKELNLDIIILPGDVFDMKCTTQNNSNILRDRLERIRELVRILSTIGNHELTYDTLFWSLTTMDSNNRCMKKAREPRGWRDIIEVHDRLSLCGVNFVFNHYGGQLLDGDVSINHGNYIPPYLSKTETELAYMQFSSFEGIDQFAKYKISFFGHLHTVMKRFRFGDKRELIYLSSLGRTSVPEITKLSNIRNIYHFEVMNGHMSEVEEHQVYLPRAQDILKINLSKTIAETIQKETNKEIIKQTKKEDNIDFIDSNYINYKMNQFKDSNEHNDIVVNEILKGNFTYLDKYR